MIENFRLFAGLMSLESILCLDHFCSSGPEGILLSRVMGVGCAGGKFGPGSQYFTMPKRIASGIETKPSQITAL